MPSSDTKKDLVLALDEGTPENELFALWRTSKSVKVRKAVASNPNAGPRLLREAARLYLEEVLSNPGFSMLELFDDDPWLMKVSAAYNNPWDFLLANRGTLGFSRTQSHDYFGWAILLSPNLDSASLDKCVQYISLGAFRRAIKTPSTLGKVQEIYRSELNYGATWPFSLETLIILSNENVITQEEVFAGLSNYGLGSTSASKSTFTKYIKKLHCAYATDSFQRDFIPRLLGKLLLVSRSHTMHWMWNSFTTQEVLSWAGDLYAATLRHMTKVVGSKISLVVDNLRAVGTIVTQLLNSKFIKKNGPTTSQDLTNVYKFVKAYGLEDQKFSRFGLVLTNDKTMDELDKCEIEVKEFFCRAGCLGNWASASDSNTKYKILNDVNNYIYAKNSIDVERLLYTKCSTRKVISLDDDTYIL